MKNKIIQKDNNNGILEVEGSEEFVQAEIDKMFRN